MGNAVDISYNNITIAEFDGWKRKKLSSFSEEVGKDDIFDWEREVRPDVFEKNYGGSFNYNTSWNSIMPVYKKLSEKLNDAKDKIEKSNHPNKHSLLKHIDYCDCTIRCNIWGVRIEDVFYGIAETIKLYNQKFNISDNQES